MEPRKRVTIKDVAREAGLSVAAVSQALRPTERSTVKVSEATRERVVAVARKLDYRRHAGAGSIRSSRFQNVGFFVAKMGPRTRAPEGYLRGVVDGALLHDYRVVFSPVATEAGEYRETVPGILREKNLDALIITSHHAMTAEIHAELEGSGLPIVYLNDRHPHNAVYVDEAAGAREMTRHLVGSGYKRIAFLLRKSTMNPPLSRMHHSARERIDGYRRAMRAAGLEPDVRTVLMRDLVEENQRMPEDWLPEGEPLPEAVFCYDDDLANSVAKLFYRRGIHVPRDVALAGYNGSYAALCAWCPLTTILLPTYEMGRAAFSMAMELVEAGGDANVPSLKFMSTLSVGESTR
ncbi:MAG: LacI family DNA-binding transcriptional regulator [Opitutales bacterium]|nr:LacI family DNA-binding transcriptional regulator [Opitutales bacterium]